MQFNENGDLIIERDIVSAGKSTLITMGAICVGTCILNLILCPRYING